MQPTPERDTIIRLESEAFILWTTGAGVIITQFVKNELVDGVKHSSLDASVEDQVALRELLLVRPLLSRHLHRRMDGEPGLVQDWIQRRREALAHVRRQVFLPGDRVVVEDVRKRLSAGDVGELSELVDMARCANCEGYVLAVVLDDSGWPDYVDVLVPSARHPMQSFEVMVQLDITDEDQAEAACANQTKDTIIVLNAFSTEHLRRP